MQVSQAEHHTKETSNLLRFTVIFSLRSDSLKFLNGIAIVNYFDEINWDFEVIFAVDSENVILWDVTPCNLVVWTNVSDELIHYIFKIKSKYFFRKVSTFLPGYMAYYSKAAFSNV